jgi:hypothetical protein
MSRNLFSILQRSLLAALANVALMASAQDLPQNYEESLDHPWRLEKINPDDDWTRHFRIGLVAGMNIKSSFAMSAGSFSLSGKNAQNGIYDDGYVRTDDTGNAPYNGQPATSYWGYQNSSQYDSGANTLTMHSASGFTPNAASHGSTGNTVDVGFDLAYGDSYWYWDKGKLGWEFGFGLLPINISHGFPSMPGTVSSTAYTFQLPTGPNGPVIPPEAPYDGPSSGIGPLLYFNPIGTSAGSSIPNATMSSTESLNVMLYTVRLGPSMYWDISEHIGMYASAGPAVGLAAGNLEYDDTISYDPGGGTITVHNHSSTSGAGVTYGGYVNAEMVYHAVQGGDFFLGAQFMPMSSTTISGGGRSGKLDLSGQLYITAGINWPF